MTRCAGRDAGVKIVHCLVQRRPDGLGGNHNAKIFAIGSGVDIAPGSPGASLLPELGPAPTDVVLRRSHGIGPMGGTDLDATLRNLGVSTIVAVGVSVNVAITNLVMDAVNLAYRVVVPRDAVAGIPADYATSIIDNTLSLLATVTTTDDLIEAVEAAVTDTEDEIREFARITPVDAAPEMARFMAAMRRLQDIAVSTNPDEHCGTTRPSSSKALCAAGEAQGAAGVAPAGRARTCPESAIP